MRETVAGISAVGSGLVALPGYFCAYAGSVVFGGVVMGELVHGTLNGPNLPWYVWASIFWAASSILGYFKVELSAKVLTISLFLEVVIVVACDVLPRCKAASSARSKGASIRGPVRVFGTGNGKRYSFARN
ncbi:hypothetical protein SB659_17545 [Arthrobacter sp. SIMBA_036]|uniref:hypothetical protein n=1 Tax=Arthrobacter sp. SIMBA_036 TaxID=3085778 RepID=UPI00397DB5AC